MMQHDNFFAEIESHSESYRSRFSCGILIEYILTGDSLESRSIVLKSDDKEFVISSSSKYYGWSLWPKELDSIFEEVIDHLLELYLVDTDDSDSRIYCCMEYDMFMHLWIIIHLIGNKIGKY